MTVQNTDYVRIFGVNILKPVVFGQVRTHGLETLRSYLFSDSLGPFIGRTFLGRGGTQSRLQRIADKLLQAKENNYRQNYKVRFSEMAPGLDAYYNQGIGTSVIQDMYTALIPDRQGRLRETILHTRKFGEHEPSDTQLSDQVRHSRDRYESPLEAQRDIYEQMHSDDFDITAMFDRTNGDSEKFIDLKTLRRWTVRDEMHLLKRKFYRDSRTLTVDGVAYTVRRYTAPFKTVDAQPKPRWDLDLALPHFLFSTVYKLVDIGYNLIPTQGLKDAAKQNFTKEEYKAVASFWRALVGGEELAFNF